MKTKTTQPLSYRQCQQFIVGDYVVGTHWIYDVSQREQAKAEVMEALSLKGEVKTTELNRVLERFRDEPLVRILGILHGLEKEGKVASRLNWFDEGDRNKGQYFTWRLYD
jgi:hypothetical protein